MGEASTGGPALSARLAYVESKIGGAVSPDLLRVDILGHRLIVAVDPAEERTAGGIIIPQSTADAQRSGSGYIVKIGEQVGLGNMFNTASYDPWFDEKVCKSDSFLDRQLLTIGRHVCYGQFAGRTLRLGPADHEHSTDYEMIHAKDILFFHNDEKGFALKKENSNA